MKKTDKGTRPEKKAMMEEVYRQLTDSVFLILTDYQGLNVGQTEDLRTRLRAVDAEYHVVKNTMLRRAMTDLDYADVDQALAGPTAMVIGKSDMVDVAKVLCTFIKENEVPVIKIGSMTGIVLTPEDVKRISTLPGREALYAQVVGTLAAPLTQMVGVLNQKLCSLLYVLKAVQEKKEKG